MLRAGWGVANEGSHEITFQIPDHDFDLPQDSQAANTKKIFSSQSGADSATTGSVMNRGSTAWTRLWPVWPCPSVRWRSGHRPMSNVQVISVSEPTPEAGLNWWIANLEEPKKSCMSCRDSQEFQTTGETMTGNIESKRFTNAQALQILFHSKAA